MNLTSLAASFVVGLGVGVVYAFVGVRSPAPPVVALVGLLGMLTGEQIVSRWLRPAAARESTSSVESMQGATGSVSEQMSGRAGEPRE